MLKLTHEPGENVERYGGGGASLSPSKHRPVAKAADFPSFSQHMTQIAPDEREGGSNQFLALDDKSIEWSPENAVEVPSRAS